MEPLRASTSQTPGLTGPLIIMADYLVRPYVHDYLDTAALATSTVENIGAVLSAAGATAAALWAAQPRLAATRTMA